MGRGALEDRVQRAAVDALAAQRYVSAVDVLVRLGWLAPTDVDRTHWVSSQLSPARRERLAERSSRPPDLVVISPVKEWTCTCCAGTGDLLIMREGGPECMRCAGLDHLEFLAAGDAGLTRRAHRASDLSAVVVRFSKTRKRYERQGLLVEPAALESARGEAGSR